MATALQEHENLYFHIKKSTLKKIFLIPSEMILSGVCAWAGVYVLGTLDRAQSLVNISDIDRATLIGVEYGYRQCELGVNLQTAIKNAQKNMRRGGK